MSKDLAPDSNGTAGVIHRFNEVFLRHDPAPLRELIADDCVIENISPAPNGARTEGRDACVKLWKAMATKPGTHFDLEETFVAEDRAIVRWRYWPDENTSIRGVNVMRIRDGLIVEALGYVKG